MGEYENYRADGNEGASSPNPLKKIVVDSSSLITISDSCIMKIVRHVSEREKISFIIPESVYVESVENPLHIKKYELNAIRIRDAVDEGYLSVAKSTAATREWMDRLSAITATLKNAGGRQLRLLQWGESETLGLLKETGANILMIDERTTRLLIEDPAALTGILSKRHGTQVGLDREKMKWFSANFSGTNVIRSVELIALAYEDGSMDSELHKSRQALEAALYAAKFSGCAVSEAEIQEYLRKA